MIRYLLISVVFMVAVSGQPENDNFDFLTENFNLVQGKALKYKVAPYQVSIQRYRLHRCTGSILDTKHILTSAHCVKDVKVSTLAVRSGSVTKGMLGSLHKVSEVHVHPDYDADKGKNDLAILDLETEIEVSPQSKPIPVQQAMPEAGQLILMTEFDNPKDDTSTPDILLGMYVPVISSEVCKTRFPGYNDDMICAELPKVGNDICKGDGGGPAIIRGKLVGVTVVGAGCGKDSNLGVYMAVSKFIPFIQKYSSPKLV